MDYDLVISGRVFYRGELQQAEVGVKGRRPSVPGARPPPWAG